MQKHSFFRIAALLLSLLLVTAFPVSLLCGCNTTPGDVSGDPESVPTENSEPQKTPDEVVGEAADNLRASFTGWMEGTPLPRLLAAREEGSDAPQWKKTDFGITCDRLSVGGQEIVSSPVDLNISGGVSGENSIATVTCSLRGDPLEMTLTRIGTLYYLFISNVTEEPLRFDADTFTAFIQKYTGTGNAGDEPSIVLTAAKETSPSETASEIFSKLKEAYEALKADIAELSWTESETGGGSVYTMTLEESSFPRFAEKMKDLTEQFPATDTEPDPDGEPEPDPDGETEKSPFADVEKIALTRTLSNDGKLQNESVALLDKDGKTLYEGSVRYVTDGNSAEAVLTGTKGDKTVAEGSFKVTNADNACDIAASFRIPDEESGVETSFRFTKEENGKLSFSGTVRVTVKYDGMIVTVPVTLEGNLSAEGNDVGGELHFTSEAKSVLDADIRLTYRLSPDEPDIGQPEKSAPLEDQDGRQLLMKMTAAYPEFLTILQYISGAQDEPTYSIPDDFEMFTTEDMSFTMAFSPSWHQLELSVSGSCVDDVENAVLHFRYGSKDYGIPYVIDADGTISLLGFDTYGYRTEEALMLIGSDEPNGISLIIDESSGGATLIISLSWDGNTDAFTLNFPDGTALSLPTVWKDADTLLLDGEFLLSRETF